MSFVLFGATLELSYFDLIHSYSSSRPDLKSLQAIISIYLFAFAAIAYLANKLASRMRQAEVELKHKSFELENLQVLHGIIVRSVSSGLLTTDLDGAVMLVNPAAQILLGRGQQDLVGLNVDQLFLDRLPSPGAARNEVRALTPGGAEKLLGIGCSPAVWNRWRHHRPHLHLYRPHRDSPPRARTPSARPPGRRRTPRLRHRP